MSEAKRDITPKDVNEAVDIIADYCGRLPDMYRVRITFWNDEVNLDIYDDNDNELPLDTEDHMPENWPTKEVKS